MRRRLLGPTRELRDADARLANIGDAVRTVTSRLNLAEEDLGDGSQQVVSSAPTRVEVQLPIEEGQRRLAELTDGGRSQRGPGRLRPA